MLAAVLCTACVCRVGGGGGGGGEAERRVRSAAGPRTRVDRRSASIALAAVVVAPPLALSHLIVWTSPGLAQERLWSVASRSSRMTQRLLSKRLRSEAPCPTRGKWGSPQGNPRPLGGACAAPRPLRERCLSREEPRALGALWGAGGAGRRCPRPPPDTGSTALMTFRVNSWPTNFWRQGPLRGAAAVPPRLFVMLTSVTPCTVTARCWGARRGPRDPLLPPVRPLVALPHRVVGVVGGGSPLANHFHYAHDKKSTTSHST